VWRAGGFQASHIRRRPLGAQGEGTIICKVGVCA
jgi:hypothetical protein